MGARAYWCRGICRMGNHGEWDQCKGSKVYEDYCVPASAAEAALQPIGVGTCIPGLQRLHRRRGWSIGRRWCGHIIWLQGGGQRWGLGAPGDAAGELAGLQHVIRAARGNGERAGIVGSRGAGHPVGAACCSPSKSSRGAHFALHSPASAQSRQLLSLSVQGPS